jgi:hypothetical protein
VTVPTPAELQDILVTILAGAAGGDETTWRTAIGPVTKLAVHTNIHSNWSIEPTGDAATLAAIAQAVDIVRAAHPYVARPAKDSGQAA